MKVIRILIIYCLILNSAFAQDLINVKEFDPSAHYNDITPPSPTVAALNKFIETPVNYYTGVPQISIPIWQIKNKDLTHNISIDYHAGGIKVNEIASWVGLGWSLKAGGTISRSVRGLPDDQSDGRGYLTSPYNYDIIIPYMKSGADSQENFDFSWNVAKQGYDSEPDIFYFSVGDLSGTFVIDCTDKMQISQKNIHLIPWQNIIINPKVTVIDFHPKITGFDIVDENGVVYIFGTTQESREWSVTSSVTDAITSPTSSYYSSWHLNKIESKRTGATINFSYKNVLEEYDDTWFLSEYNRLQVISTDLSELTDKVDKVFKNVTYVHQSSLTSKLDNISFDLGNATFIPTDNQREDLKHESSSSGSILGSIIIKDDKNEQIKKYTLNHSYFNGEITNANYLLKRLKLNSIEEISLNEEILKYEFNYSSTNLPPRDSYATDFWGYYTNPAKSWSKIPELYWGSKYYSGGEKTPDFNYTKAGILESIKFPTGGITKYEYEQNTYRYNGDLTLGLEEGSREFFADIAHPDGAEPKNAIVKSKGLTLNKEQFIYSDFERDNSSFTAAITNEQGESWELHDKTKLSLFPGNYTVTLKASHVCADNCGLLAGTSAALTIRYVEQLDDSIKYKECGGLRIKSIKDYSPENALPKRIHEYIYTESGESEPGFSSGVLVAGEPTYHFTKTIRHKFPAPYTAMLQDVTIDISYLVIQSDYLNSFNLTQGSCVGYSKVTVHEINSENSEKNGKIVCYYTSGKDFPVNTSFIYPEARRVSNDWLLGKLKRKEIKDNNDNYKQIENYYYNPIYVYDVDGEPLATGYKLLFSFYNTSDEYGVDPSSHWFAWDKYSYESGYVFLDSITKEIYNGSEPIVLKEYFKYDPNKFLLKEHTNETANEKFKTTYTYPFDYISEGDVISNHDDPLYKLYEMKTFHMDSNPVEVVTEKEVGGVAKVVGANLIKYKNYHPYKIYGLNNGVSKIDFTPSGNSGGSFVFDEDNYELNATITRSHLRNPSVIEKRDGSVTSYIWGYKDNFPVAKIDNYDIIKNPVFEASAITDILESTDQDFIDGQIQTLRNHTGLNAALITSFAYKPLIGLTRQIDPNNKSLFYKYDAMQRLEMIKDDESNILKVYKYNYAYPTVSVLPSEINFDFNGGTKVIKLAPGEYSIGSYANWLDHANTNYDPATGSLTISCEKNQTTLLKKGTFELINNGKSETANVSQNALPFTLSKNELQIPFGKHLDVILVNAAEGINLSLKNLPSWVNRARTTFTNYHQIEQMLYVSFDDQLSDFQKELEYFYDPTADPNQTVLLVWAYDNPNFSERQGGFIVAGSGLEETVTIAQDAKVLSFNVAHNLDVFEYSLIPQTISVESNAGVVINGSDWIRLRVQDPNSSGDLPTDDSFLNDLTNSIYVPEGDYVIEIFCLEDNSTIGIKSGNIEVIPGIESEKVIIPIQQQCVPVSFNLNNSGNINLTYHSVNNESFGKILTYNIPWTLQVDYQGTASGWITPGFNGVGSVTGTSTKNLGLTIENNSSNSNRIAVIKLKPLMQGVNEISYSITQSFAYLNLITTWLPQFSVSGGKQVILFDTNIPETELSVSTPSWLTSSIMLGNVAKNIVGLSVPDVYLNKPVLVVTAALSNSPTNQTGNATISGAGKSVSTEVSQAGNPVVVNISGTNLTAFNYNGSDVKTINVSSNYDNYTVESNQSWLKIKESQFNPGGPFGDYRTLITGLSGPFGIDVKCDAKTTVGNRTGAITITSMGVSKSLTITQNGVPAYLNVSTSALSYACNVGSKNITVSSNVVWSVSDNASWITTSKSGNTVTISVSGYDGWNSTRSGKVTVSGGGINQLINITQAGPTNPGAISGNSLICAGSTNTYSIAGVNCATSYTWEVPAGWSIASGQGTATVNVIPSSSSGTLKVKANTSSGSSAYSTTSINIVSSAPDMPASISGPISVQPNTTYTYTVNEVPGASSYTWYLPSGTTVISGWDSRTLQVSFSDSAPKNTAIRVKANNCIGTSSLFLIFIIITDTPFD